MKKENSSTDSLWNDMDTALLRAKQICPDIELPQADDSMEIGIYKVVLALNKLCDKYEKPIIYKPGV